MCSSSNGTTSCGRSKIAACGWCACGSPRVLGNLKSFAISPAGFDNTLIEDGMTLSTAPRSTASRGSRRPTSWRSPTPTRSTLLPWGVRQGAPRRASVCDIHHLDGTPFDGDPRQVLQAPRARRRTPRASRSTSPPTSSSSTSSHPVKRQRAAAVRSTRASFFDLTTNDVTGSLRPPDHPHPRGDGHPRRVQLSRGRPSQQEIDLRHTDALTMADSVMTYRLIVRELAASQGLHATFMPKPLEGVTGSGMHTPTHVSRCSAATTTPSSTRTPAALSPGARRSWPVSPRPPVAAIARPDGLNG